MVQCGRSGPVSVNGIWGNFMRRFVIGTLLVPLSVPAADAALACASLQRSEPPAGATVVAAPSEMSLWFP